MENYKQYQDAVAKQVEEFRFREYQTGHYWELGTQTVGEMADALGGVLADGKVKLMFSQETSAWTAKERTEYAHELLLLEALIIFLKDLNQRQIECDTEKRLGV